MTDKVPGRHQVRHIDELPVVSDAYFAMATARQATAAQRKLFFDIGEKLCVAQGAEVVVLVGTDLFLAFDGQTPGFPIIDSADVHIAALAQAAGAR